MFFLVDALDELVFVGFIALFVTQIAWPVLIDKPTFPLYRRWRAWRNHRAPVVSICEPSTPEKDKDEPNGNA